VYCRPTQMQFFGPQRLEQVCPFSSQADPAIAVKEDARETTELDPGAPATMEEDHPPGFVSAAKREHQNEAAVLRMHRLQVQAGFQNGYKPKYARWKGGGAILDWSSLTGCPGWGCCR